MTWLADAMRDEPPTVDLTAYLVAAGRVGPLPPGRVPWAGQCRPAPPQHVPVGLPLRGRHTRTDDRLDPAPRTVHIVPTVVAGLHLETVRATVRPVRGGLTP